jgi:aquaporin Z
VTFGQAIVVEILFTALLVAVIYNVAIDKRTTNNQFYGLAIGFTVLAAAYAGGGISG